MKSRFVIPLILILLSFIYYMFLRSDVVDASMILVNGVVHTVNDKQPRAEAVAIVGKKIAAVGTNTEVLRNFRSSQVVDLLGKPVFPGFIDSHAHLEGLGVFLLNLDLNGTTSTEEIASRVRERVAETPAGVWIRGRGWDQNRWSQKEFPTHEVLDAAAADIPVYLTRVDGHAVWVNRKVIELAGISERTLDPEGGRIVRDAMGHPTGVFVDNAINMLESALPDPSVEERTHAILTSVRACAKVGLTGVHDMGTDLEGIGIYKKLIEDGTFPLRVYAAIDGGGKTWDYYYNRGPEIGLNDGRLTVRALKLYADGALGSYGAALIEPYSDDPGNRGLTRTSTDSIRYYGERALEKGFQLCIHAIGDRANHVVLNTYGEILRSHGGSPERTRFRIEHVQVLDRADIPRFRDLGVIPAMQPTHCTSDMYWAERRLGPERIKGAYAWRSLIASGSVVPGGSDFPVESNNPLWGFYAAITRQDHEGWPEGGWYAEERMTRDEALRAFTLWGAYAAFEEELKGSIQVGKYADLVVLNNDIMTIEPSQILQSEVDLTILGGDIVYSSGVYAHR